MAINNPPITGDAQQDSWALQVTNRLNSGIAIEEAEQEAACTCEAIEEAVDNRRRTERVTLYFPSSGVVPNQEYMDTPDYLIPEDEFRPFLFRGLFRPDFSDLVPDSSPEYVRYPNTVIDSAFRYFTAQEDHWITIRSVGDRIEFVVPDTIYADPYNPRFFGPTYPYFYFLTTLFRLRQGLANRYHPNGLNNVGDTHILVVAEAQIWRGEPGPPSNLNTLGRPVFNTPENPGIINPDQSLILPLGTIVTRREDEGDNRVYSVTIGREFGDVPPEANTFGSDYTGSITAIIGNTRRPTTLRFSLNYNFDTGELTENNRVGLPDLPGGQFYAANELYKDRLGGDPIIPNLADQFHGWGRTPQETRRYLWCTQGTITSLPGSNTGTIQPYEWSEPVLCSPSRPLPDVNYGTELLLGGPEEFAVTSRGFTVQQRPLDYYITHPFGTTLGPVTISKRTVLADGTARTQNYTHTSNPDFGNSIFGINSISLTRRGELVTRYTQSLVRGSRIRLLPENLGSAFQKVTRIELTVSATVDGVMSTSTVTILPEVVVDVNPVEGGDTFSYSQYAHGSTLAGEALEDDSLERTGFWRVWPYNPRDVFGSRIETSWRTVLETFMANDTGTLDFNYPSGVTRNVFADFVLRRLEPGDIFTLWIQDTNFMNIEIVAISSVARSTDPDNTSGLRSAFSITGRLVGYDYDVDALDAARLLALDTQDGIDAMQLRFGDTGSLPMRLNGTPYRHLYLPSTNFQIYVFAPDTWNPAEAGLIDIGPNPSSRFIDIQMPSGVTIQKWWNTGNSPLPTAPTGMIRYRVKYTLLHGGITTGPDRFGGNAPNGLHMYYVTLIPSVTDVPDTDQNPTSSSTSLVIDAGPGASLTNTRNISGTTLTGLSDVINAAGFTVTDTTTMTGTVSENAVTILDTCTHLVFPENLVGDLPDFLTTGTRISVLPEYRNFYTGRSQEERTNVEEGIITRGYNPDNYVTVSGTPVFLPLRGYWYVPISRGASDGTYPTGANVNYLVLNNTFNFSQFQYVPIGGNAPGLDEIYNLRYYYRTTAGQGRSDLPALPPPQRFSTIFASERAAGGWQLTGHESTADGDLWEAAGVLRWNGQGWASSGSFEVTRLQEEGELVADGGGDAFTFSEYFPVASGQTTTTQSGEVVFPIGRFEEQDAPYIPIVKISCNVQQTRDTLNRLDEFFRTVIRFLGEQDEGPDLTSFQYFVEGDGTDNATPAEESSIPITLTWNLPLRTGGLDVSLQFGNRNSAVLGTGVNGRGPSSSFMGFDSGDPKYISNMEATFIYLRSDSTRNTSNPPNPPFP